MKKWCLALITACLLPIGVEAAPLLAINSHGHDVQVLQQHLKKYNYAISDEEGNFGNSTMAAVKAFQRAHHLAVTGTVDRSTWQALKGEGKKVATSLGEENLNKPTLGEEVGDVQVGSTNPMRNMNMGMDLWSYGDDFNGEAEDAACGIPDVNGKGNNPVQQPPMPVGVKPEAPVVKPISKAPIWKKIPSNKGKKGKDSQGKNKVRRPQPINVERDLNAVPMGKTIINPKQAAAIISTAKSLVGTPYTFGGDTPSGFDCSGYLAYVFARHGMKIPRTADVQYKMGRKKDLKGLKPGDLVFFSTYTKGVSHSGIYLGNNRFIHASTSRGVIVDDLQSDYWRKAFYGAKKIVE